MLSKNSVGKNEHSTERPCCTGLAEDLTSRFGKGFSERNLLTMREFYRAWSIPRTASAESEHLVSRPRFPLPWSHYVRLLSVKNQQARSFYESEALRGGWSVRQLDRQIATQFFERTQLSRNKAAILHRGHTSDQQARLNPKQEIKDPLVLEFLGLKDEYSENALEEALIHQFGSPGYYL